MANNSETLQAEDVRHPSVSYDRTDLSHRAVFGFFLALVIAAIVLHISVWGFFKVFGKSEYAGHQTTNPIMTSNEQLQPIGGDPALSFPAPRLQPDPVADLNKFRVSEEEQLNTYGWVDPKANRIRIPIERAINILAKSWPSQQQDSEPPAKPVYERTTGATINNGLHRERTKNHQGASNGQ